MPTFKFIDRDSNFNVVFGYTSTITYDVLVEEGVNNYVVLDGPMGPDPADSVSALVTTFSFGDQPDGFYVTLQDNSAYFPKQITWYLTYYTVSINVTVFVFEDQTVRSNTMDGTILSLDNSTYVCGNGILDLNEECDDANFFPGDGCTKNCTVETGPYCGDGYTDALYGEQCDAGYYNGIEVYGCTQYCTYVVLDVENGNLSIAWQNETYYWPMMRVLMDDMDVWESIFFSSLYGTSLLDTPRTFFEVDQGIYFEKTALRNNEGQSIFGEWKYIQAWYCEGPDYVLADYSIPLSLSTSWSDTKTNRIVIHPACDETQVKDILRQSITSKTGYYSTYAEDSYNINGGAMIEIVGDLIRDTRILTMSKDTSSIYGSCVNINATEHAYNKNNATQKTCAANALLNYLAHFCSNEISYETARAYRWDLNIYDGTVKVVETENSLVKSFGIIGGEDGAIDKDFNEVVIAMRTACIYKTNVQNNDSATDFWYMRECKTHLHPMAKGGGFDLDVVLSLDGTVTPFPEGTNITERCQKIVNVPLSTSNTNSTPFFQQSDMAGAKELGVTQTIRIYDLVRSDAASINMPYEVTTKRWISKDQQTATEVEGDLFGKFVSDHVGNDYKIYENMTGYWVLPIDQPYQNVFPDQISGYQKPVLDIVQRFIPLNPILYNTTDISTANVPFPRLYTKNQDCGLNIDMFQNDENMVDNDGKPLSYYFSPGNLWCWPLEGVPIVLTAITGQCMFGENTGRTCNETFNQCPYGECIKTFNRCSKSLTWHSNGRICETSEDCYSNYTCVESPPTVTYGTCYGGISHGSNCSGPSQCPYGLKCYVHDGAYPSFDTHIICKKQGCYGLNPPGSCESNGCYTDQVENWYNYVASPIPDQVYPLPFSSYRMTAT